MRVLLSTFGSRGDVQPMIELGLVLQRHGVRARLCVPPNFADLVGANGLEFAALGFDLREGGRHVAGGPAATVAANLDAIGAAVRDCDAVVGCSAMQMATRTVAEARGVPYVYAVYAPVALPSPHHGPLPVYPPIDSDERAHAEAWARDAAWWNDTWGPGLNSYRSDAGLHPLDDVRTYVITERPLLAADPALAPWQLPTGLDVEQTGVWLGVDRRPLPPDVEAFLERDEPPLYFGFGSMLTPRASIATVVGAARAHGRRAVVLKGWAKPDSTDEPPADDWIAVGETNQQHLFTRVAAAVHHGGCGTLTIAALAGVPQVVVPHHYDQPYYAGRVAALGIGAAHPDGDVTIDTLAAAVEHALNPGVASAAAALRARVHTDGAEVAAREILQRMGSHAR